MYTGMRTVKALAWESKNSQSGLWYAFEITARELPWTLLVGLTRRGWGSA